jgi:putative membrane protein
MMWGYGSGMWAGWLWMLPMMLLFWGAIIALIVFAIRGFGPRRSDDSALDMLRGRLASGAISQEEFERTRQLLQK